MSALYIILVAAFLHAARAANCNGGTAGSSRMIYNASQTMDDTDGKPVRCDYNLCNNVKITITRIVITGDFQCIAGGPGDFNVAIIVQAWKSFHATIWATGKDVNKIADPTNPQNFPCTVDMSDKCP